MVYCVLPSLTVAFPVRRISHKVRSLFDQKLPEMDTTTSSSGLIVSLREVLGDKIRLILASRSPRRRDILDMMGLNGRYDTIPSTLDESELQLRLLGRDGTSPLVSDPREYTRILAEEKARVLAFDVLDHLVIPTLILGSDTIVDQDSHILEKPVDAADAKRMIAHLSGKRHNVHTGVAIFRAMNGKVEKIASFTDTANVFFADLSQADIDAYVETMEPMDKAGAYGIQGIGGQFVHHLEGDFFTVSGS